MFEYKRSMALSFLFFMIGSVIFARVVIAGEVSDWMFEHLDANSDGTLSKKEFRGSYLDGEGDDWTIGLRPACTDAVIEAMDPQLNKTFKEMDTTKDGKISKGEFATAGLAMYNGYWQKTFKLADKNNDGKLSSKEFINQINDHYDNLKKDYAVDKIPSDCQVDLNELYANEEEITTAKEYFTFLDSNGDGKLSQEEYMAKENN